MRDICARPFLEQASAEKSVPRAGTVPNEPIRLRRLAARRLLASARAILAKRFVLETVEVVLLPHLNPIGR